MKILYAIQGTGNGHVSRARDIIPHLSNHGELDVLISGTEAEVSLPIKPKYKISGLGYVFGKHGGIDYLKSVSKLHLYNLLRDIRTFPLEKYDLIINDFEPVTAWAARLRKKEIVSLSHQCSFASPLTPRPDKKDFFAEKVLVHYAPCKNLVGFHFKPYDTFIHTPVIRSEVRQMEVSNKGHITVYLPAYADQILVKIFSKVKLVRWEIFSKHTKIPYDYQNVSVKPVSGKEYNESLASSLGLLTGGGFESPAEAIHLGKKLLVIPMTDQYEQKCNAEALRLMGVPVVHKMDEHFIPTLQQWIENTPALDLQFPDETEKLIAQVVQKFGRP